MKNLSFIIVIILGFIILFACTSKSLLEEKPQPEATFQENQSTAKEPLKREWEKTMALAQKEGRVVLYCSSGSEVRDALVPKFKKATGIDLEMTIGRGSEMTAKILSQIRAGLFLADVYIGGLDSIVNNLKAAGVLEPIRPYLILEEVTNPNLWYKNELSYADNEKRYIMTYQSLVQRGASAINTDMVRANELTSYFDYLKPEWKGKLSMKDPTMTGRSLNWFHTMLAYKSLDIDYMKELVKTEPRITRDDRIQMEWLVRGKYPIALNPSPSALPEFRKMGFPLPEIGLKEDLNIITAAQGLTVFNKAPHPNTTKVFLNWFLSKEGQTINTRVSGYQSRRLDTPVDHLLPDSIRDPKAEYIITENEDFKSRAPEYLKLAGEIFGPLVR